MIPVHIDVTVGTTCYSIDTTMHAKPSVGDLIDFGTGSDLIPKGIRDVTRGNSIILKVTRVWHKFLTEDEQCITVETRLLDRSLWNRWFG